MKSYLFKWSKVVVPGITGYRIFRVKEDENIEASKLDLTAAAIGSVDADTTSFVDDTAYDDHTAYHYAVAAIVGGQLAAVSRWKRVWRRYEWGPGGDVILHGDEENGYLGSFAGAGEFLPSDTTLPAGQGAVVNSYTDVHKFIYKKRLVLVPHNLIGEINTIAVRLHAYANTNMNALRNRLEAEGKSSMELGNIAFSFQRLVPAALGLRLAGLSVLEFYCYIPRPLGLTTMINGGWAGNSQFIIGGMHNVDAVTDPTDTYATCQFNGVNIFGQSYEWTITGTSSSWSWSFTGCWVEPDATVPEETVTE